LQVDKEVTKKASYKLTKTPLYSLFTKISEENPNLRVLLELSLTLLSQKETYTKKIRYKCPIGRTSVTLPFFTLF